MMGLLLASTMLPSVAAAQVEVELVQSDPDAMAPIRLTVTASTPLDEPILAYQWSGIGVAPRCKAASCQLDFPLAACRRVYVTVTDRFGADTTTDRQICANERGAQPPQARIEVVGNDVMLRGEDGDENVIIERLWIDETLLDSRTGELPKDDACHTIDAMRVDAQGRIGLDHQVVCGDARQPSIWVGGDPSFCPRAAEPLSICTEVDDPLGMGLTRHPETMLPLDECIVVEAPQTFRRYIGKGRSGELDTFGSSFGCTAPESGRPTLPFVRISTDGVVERERLNEITVLVYGGEAPYQASGTLTGGGDLAAAVATSEAGLLTLRFDVTRDMTLDQLSVEVTDSRGFSDMAEREIRTVDPMVGNMPPPTGTPSDATIGCRSSGARGGSFWLLLPLALLWMGRRRR